MRPEHIRFGSLGGQTRFRTFPSRVGAGSINVLTTFGRFGQNAQLVSETSANPPETNTCSVFPSTRK